MIGLTEIPEYLVLNSRQFGSAQLLGAPAIWPEWPLPPERAWCEAILKFWNGPDSLYLSFALSPRVCMSCCLCPSVFFCQSLSISCFVCLCLFVYVALGLTIRRCSVFQTGGSTCVGIIII